MIAVQVSKFITQNNPFWAWPYRFMLGVGYQLYKRTVQKPVLKKLFNGKFIKLYPDCHVSSEFVYTQIPDKKEIMRLRRAMKSNTTFMDIGANIGAYSVLLADKTEKIIAFEPDEGSFSRLKENLSLNQGLDFQVEKIALSNYVGEGKFSDLDAKTTNKLVSDDETGVVVKVTTLDEYASTMNLSKDKSYLLKIDVEGAELETLQGARDFLTTYLISGILFESFDERFPLVKPYLESLGFQIERIAHHNYWASFA